MVELQALSRRFGSVVAVDGLTTSIGDRGLVGFLGPNGAGKTTTMRMLTGYLPATSGKAIVAGVDVFEDPLTVKARVGYLPEAPPLYLELTVGEYLRFVAEVRGVSRAERVSRVGEVMEQVGLQGWERRRLITLSKGYRQRVGLAQAIVHRPRLLILDEPTAGLDPGQVVAVRRLIRSLAADRTVILSTHVLAEVELLCDRILLMNRGKLVGDGTVAELAERVSRGPLVEVVVDAPHDDLCAPIAQLAGVTTVERTGPGSYRVRGGREVEPALAAAAGAAGWQVRLIARRTPGLEEVFLNLVGAET